MIDQITIENFKAIGARVTVPIKPITLLFGPNGAGKSSILHALFYLREILERNNLDAGYTLTCGDRIDLGGFRNFVHARDLRRAVTVGIRFQYDAGSNYFDGSEFSTNGYGGIPCSCSVMVSVSFTENAASPIATYTVSYDDEPMFTVTPHQPKRGGLRIDSLNCRHPLWLGIADTGFNHNELLAHFIKDFDARVVSPGAVSFNSKVPHDFSITDFGGLYGARGFPIRYTDYTDLDAPAIFGTFFTFAIREARDLINRMIAVGPLRDSPPRGQIGTNRPSLDPARWYTGLGAWDYLLRGETWMPGSNPSTSDQRQAGHTTDHDLKLVHRVSGALKDTLDTGFSLQRDEVKYFVESTTDTSGGYRFCEHLRSFEKQIGALPDAELQAAYQDILREADRLPRDARLMLHDHRSDIDVAPHDIGVGVSQVLPVVTAALSVHPLVVIEQPELHIHPRMQVTLGDVFLEGLKTKGKQFIIETHSEHLVLRLLRRIREKMLTPDDLAVIYVEPGDGEPGARSTRVLQLRVDDRGEFIDVWPRGFFDERGDELFA